MRGKQQFDRVFESGTRLSGQFFLVHRAAGNAATGQLGLVVAKRIAVTSVVRNRVKRLIRETYRVSPLAAKPIDIIVRFRRLPGASQWQQAREELDRLLEKCA